MPYDSQLDFIQVGTMHSALLTDLCVVITCTDVYFVDFGCAVPMQICDRGGMYNSHEFR
jgi:hypothetical protein